MSDDEARPAPSPPASRLLAARVRRHVLDVDLTLDLTAAPVTVVFGPSGAGKTTLLRCVAGLDRPAPGSRVTFDGTIWDDDATHLPTQRRGLGFLFQDHALFPHLDVDANVAYGLHRLPGEQRPARIREALRAAGAGHLAGRRTPELSGGEAQRVALARALAPRPRLLLLDEPLAALDGPTRTRLRTELRALLVTAGIPALVVTHDRTEALTLGDQLAVLDGGRLHQLGPVPEVFSRPATPGVAAIVETETVTPGRVVAQQDGLATTRCGTAEILAVSDLPAGTDVLVCVRAEEVALALADDGGSARNRLPAVVTAVSPAGPLVRVNLDAGFPLAAYVTRPAREELGLAPGARVLAVLKAPAVHLVPR